MIITFGRKSKNSEQGFQATNSYKEMIWRPLIKPSAIVFFLFLLLIGGFVCTYFINIPILTGSTFKPIYQPKTFRPIILATNTSQNFGPKVNGTAQKCPGQNKKFPKYSSTDSHIIPINCSTFDRTQICPSCDTTFTFQSEQDSNFSSKPSTCPEYFRWIYEDLRPWSHTGISKEMMHKAKKKAHFKLVIVDGIAYVERYDRAYQTRDLFTWWGIVQLLRKYPGKLPDLELVFNCHDRPVILSKYNTVDPPTLFSFCGDDHTVDLAFPDWSFWGWPEVNIKPWELLMKDIERGSKKMKWVDRQPYAYWKGNPAVARTRRDLLKCNVTKKKDWNARLYVQDWRREFEQGYKNSDMADQCTHRFKIYIEGNGWSVSRKYILACDSLTLLVNPKYYDFSSRGLKPMEHYWPIKANDKCRSIKYAVDWGNTHEKEVQAIGREAVKFIQEELKMDYVYDYMFHLLNEYAKLFKFKPEIPENAFQLCLESLYCPARGLERTYMMDSMWKGPDDTKPCTIPPPYSPSSLFDVLHKKTDVLKHVDIWEKQQNHWIIGAIDCTHIPATVPRCDARSYLNRQGIISQNILIVCNFDL
ncbi:uncharacterized protein LOC107418578 isoform X1 [Ziziphus jujuba]|uniref:Uncharacterized protein LOC107418578 isoform X1 n=1 Tax=Ziziphus jujuba TaxID=326968 RepID=A0ABM3IJ10_ZIZJJ|nr:uncharacterized protein LOC107418578 isoform X1 [Ziziphus jujuba]